MTIAAIVLKRYQLNNGRYPSRLEDLVPQYLSEVPVDWMDGKPLRYHPNRDGTYTLYSIGEDFVDNGGDPAPTTSGSTPSYYMWNTRDAVWPWPATEAEIRAAEKAGK